MYPSVTPPRVVGSYPTHPILAQKVYFGALGEQKYMDQCRDLGAKGFVGKPFNKEDIEHYLDLYVMERLNK